MTTTATSGRGNAPRPDAGEEKPLVGADRPAPTDVLAIVGSTRFVSTMGLRRASDIISALLNNLHPDQVITSWGGNGVPNLAEQAARTRKIDFKSYEPTGHHWSGAGGQQTYLHLIASACTRMVFICCAEKGVTFAGTYAPRLAMKMGKPVDPYYILGDGHVQKTAPERKKKKRPVREPQTAPVTTNHPGPPLAAPTIPPPPYRPIRRRPAPTPVPSPPPVADNPEDADVPLEVLYKGVSDRWRPKNQP